MLYYEPILYGGDVYLGSDRNLRWSVYEPDTTYCIKVSSSPFLTQNPTRDEPEDSSGTPRWVSGKYPDYVRNESMVPTTKNFRVSTGGKQKDSLSRISCLRQKGSLWTSNKGNWEFQPRRTWVTNWL